jgi:hypothetical protein
VLFLEGLKEAKTSLEAILEEFAEASNSDKAMDTVVQMVQSCF